MSEFKIKVQLFYAFVGRAHTSLPIEETEKTPSPCGYSLYKQRESFQTTSKHTLLLEKLTMHTKRNPRGLNYIHPTRDYLQCALSIKEALLLQFFSNNQKKLTSLAIRNPRGVTDSTLPAIYRCKSCRLLVVALKHILLLEFFGNNQ